MVTAAPAVAVATAVEDLLVVGTVSVGRQGPPEKEGMFEVVEGRGQKSRANWHRAEEEKSVAEKRMMG